MAMKRCPICGEKYSETYKNCPFCEEEAALQEGGIFAVAPAMQAGLPQPSVQPDYAHADLC